MDIMIRSSHGIALVNTETKLLQSRKLYISGTITDGMMVEFFQKMQILLDEDRNAPISLYIDSQGGEIRSGLAIYSMITGCMTDIDIYVLGKACSMAAVLLAAGKKGHRFLLPYAEVMIHEPLIGSAVSGSTSSVKSISDNLQEAKDIIDGILAKHTGHALKEVQEATSYDHYFKAKEAVDWGLADRILEFDELLGG